MLVGLIIAPLSLSVGPHLPVQAARMCASPNLHTAATGRRFNSRAPLSMLPSSIALPSSRRSRVPLLLATEDGGLQLPLAALSAGLTAATESAVEIEMVDLAATGGTVDLRALELDEEALDGHRSRLLAELGDIEAAGVVFQTDGVPTPSTLGIALVLTARKASELDVPSMADLLATNESGGAHAARANLALATVVNDTLAAMEAAEQFTDASETARVSVNDSAPEQTMEDARAMHMRWAILELARARYAEDRPEDWGK